MSQSETIEVLKRILLLIFLFLATSCRPADSTNNSTNTNKNGDPKLCPLVACAAPPANCRYMGAMWDDECQVSCGTLICDQEVCPIPECAAPPVGCHYGSLEIVDGCPVSCGTLICDEICPMILCIAPPRGCVLGVPTIDDNGCGTGCGDPQCPID